MYGVVKSYVFLLVGILFSWGPSCFAQSPAPLVLGDYSAAPRVSGRVDTDSLIRKLSDLGANTYMWLIWSNEKDWDDLKVFLPKAKASGVDVWAYIVPYSETPVQDRKFRYSEPYRLDYVRWAKEVARLSLVNSNLKGYVIDDFWENISPGRFRRDYIAEILAAGRAINSKIKFYPIMYFNQIDEKSAQFLAPLVDGVVVAYPHDRAEIERAQAFLEDRFARNNTVKVSLPPYTLSKSGDRALIEKNVRVAEEARGTKVSFHYRDNFDGATSGYHQFQLRIDDKVAWKEDLAGYDDGDVTVDISDMVRGKKVVKLSVGVVDIAGVGNFGFEALIYELRAQGLSVGSERAGRLDDWSVDASGTFSIVVENKLQGNRKFRIPMIVMAAGSAVEYELRYHGKGTPENIANSVKMISGAVSEGGIEGMVTFCLDKSEGSRSFSYVKDIYKSSAEVSAFRRRP